MTVNVEVKRFQGDAWTPAILTTERAESSYGQPVLVVDGETMARGTAEVYAVKPLWIGENQDAERELLAMAKGAGFFVLGM